MLLLSHVTQTGCNSKEKVRLRTDSTAGGGKAKFRAFSAYCSLDCLRIIVVTPGHNSPRSIHVEAQDSLAARPDQDFHRRQPVVAFVLEADESPGCKKTAPKAPSGITSQSSCLNEVTETKERWQHPFSLLSVDRQHVLLAQL